MPCFHPAMALHELVPGIFSNKVKFLGKKVQDNWEDHILPVYKHMIKKGEIEAVELPCGNCIGCRLERSRQWALRCIHESKFHEDNCFLTLTYDPDLKGYSPSLNKRDICLFLKSLRRKIEPQKIRFFQCGEYGDLNLHPHHHVLLFGYSFPDRVKCVTKSGQIYYRSKELESLWKHGFSSIGDLTFESAAYVARYVLKKLNGDQAQFYTDRGIIPPFVTMSRRPGIGAKFFEKFSSDFYPKDFITFDNGRRLKPPKYYDKLFEQFHGEDALKPIKDKRKQYAKLPETAVERNLARLSIKEQAAKFKAMNKKRTGDTYGNILENL